MGRYSKRIVCLVDIEFSMSIVRIGVICSNAGPPFGEDGRLQKKRTGAHCFTTCADKRSPNPASGPLETLSQNGMLGV